MKTSYKLWIILFVFAFVLNAFNVIQPIAKSETWENEFGKLEVYPDYDYNACFHEHYGNITWYKEPAYIDVAFRFNVQLDNPNIYYWHNYSHPKKINDYENIEYNYTLTNITNFQQIEEPDEVDFGDIPSDYYYNGDATVNNNTKNINIGFDSFQWLNQEHTSALFFFHIAQYVGSHYENVSYFDWHNLNHLWNYQEYNNKHYYYFQHWAITNQTYQVKFNFNTKINTNGKWDFLAKYSNETIQYALQNNRYIEICPWWDSNWDYYKTCYITNNLNDYQIKLIVGNSTGGDVNCNGHVNPDFSDLRFIYNNITELPYYIENYTLDTQCTVWINNTVNCTKLEMYYGNSGATTTSNGYTTFFFFEPFNDLGNWTFVDSTGADIGVKDNKVYLHATLVNGDGMIYANKNFFNHSIAIRFYDITIIQIGNHQLSLNADITYPSNDDEARELFYEASENDEEFRDVIRYNSPVVSESYTRFDAGTQNAYDIDTLDICIRADRRATFLLDDANSHTTTNSIDTDLNLHANLFVNDGKGYCNLTVDNLYIRNYTINEPSFTSFGSEVSQPVLVELLLNVYPFNNSINLCPCCFEINATISSNASMNITFYSNYTGSWVFINSYSNITNGSYGIMIFNFTRYNWVYYLNITLWEFNNDSNYNKSLIKYTTAQYINCSSDAILSESEELFLSNPFDVEPDILALGIIMFFFWLGYSKKDYVLTWFTSIMLLVMFIYFIVQFNAIDFIISLCLIGIAIYGFVKGFSFMVESLIEKEGKET